MLIHFDKLSVQTTDTGKSYTKGNATVLCSHSQTNNGQVLLSTAIVLIKDRQDRMHRARAILDPGSQSSLIADSL